MGWRMAHHHRGFPRSGDRLRRRLRPHLRADGRLVPVVPDAAGRDGGHSLLAGRTVPMRIWNVQGVRVEQPGETTGNSGSSTTLFALEFPCTILNVPIVRYYSELVGNNIGQYCHALAQKYRIDIHRDGINDVLRSTSHTSFG